MWIMSSSPLWFLLIEFCLIERLSLWCMRMTYGCWRRFVLSLKTISWRFPWSGLLWTLVHSWVAKIHLLKCHRTHFSYVYKLNIFSNFSLTWLSTFFL
jgi:hypothetical protein